MKRRVAPGLSVFQRRSGASSEAAEFDYVWHSLRRLGIDERNRDDVCHDVFIVVWENLDDYAPDRPLRPWLFGLAFRDASDHREKA